MKERSSDVAAQRVLQSTLVDVPLWLKSALVTGFVYT